MFIISTGIPVAWGVMDREDIPTLEAFFNDIQGKVPSAIVNTLMTDDGMYWNQYDYMYVSVLPPTDPALPVAFKSVYTNSTHILCRWQVFLITKAMH